MASPIADMHSIKSLKATPHLLSVLHSDTGHTGKGRTGEQAAVQAARRMRDSTVLVVLLLTTLGTVISGRWERMTLKAAY